MSSQLKGKRVLTANYFGTVLNEAENEPAVIIEVIRQRWEKHNDSELGRLAGVPTVRTGWSVIKKTTMVLSWGQIGEITVCESMPKFLYANRCR